MRDMEEIVGYGFHPTNEQLVGNYLRKKRLDPDYSHPKIREVNIYDFEPSELPGLALVKPDATEWYFFVALRYMNTKRKLVKRKTRGGTWKPTGKKPDVKRSKEVIGSKSKLVFYQGPSTRNKNVKTNWVMDEFHCKPDPLFKADFVVVRIKIKPNDSCDSSTTSESVTSHHLTSDSRDHIAEVTQVESEQLPNNYMSCNNEDYGADTIFSKESQPLQDHDICPTRISQSLSNHDMSPNIISQPLSHHHISLNREPDLVSNHDISSNVESLTLSNHDISFNRENQPLPNNDLTFNIEPQSLHTESLLIPNYNLCSILPHHDTSFNREVQPLSNYNLSSILPQHDTASNREVQPLPNYNISSNRESQLLLNHSFYPNIEDPVTKNTSTEVEPLVPAVSDSLIDCNGLNRKSFYTLQTQIHLQQQVLDSLIDGNGLDQNSLSAQQTQIHLQQQVLDSLIDGNGLDQNSLSAQQTQIHLQRGSSRPCDFSSDAQWGVQDEFYGKETVHSHPSGFNSSMAATEAYAYSGTGAYAYGGSDKTIDALLIDDALLYGFSPTTYGEYGFNSICQTRSYMAIDESIVPQHLGNAIRQ
ncbi:hypothetical protein Ddye_002463 [Dipteronia dyeriana]|uniref:NAC domain-containing protein n=1 Tax=Dipteronia dyeriana TaxID=168575 RepID=A0AAD9XQH4_9ROSI|nr:hypothetical protein Ddye_002463 [Dipteronia dyeriana]